MNTLDSNSLLAEGQTVGLRVWIKFWVLSEHYDDFPAQSWDLFPLQFQDSWKPGILRFQGTQMKIWRSWFPFQAENMDEVLCPTTELNWTELIFRKLDTVPGPVTEPGGSPGSYRRTRRRSRVMRFRWWSTSMTLTSTRWPGPRARLRRRRSSGSLAAVMKRLGMSPFRPTPTSTNAPNRAVLVTRPVRTAPGRRSLMETIPRLKSGRSNSEQMDREWERERETLTLWIKDS